MIFLNPYILFALLALPLVWFFLKATPPRPRTQSFPPITLLHQLQNNVQEAVHAPWWLILIRLLAITLCILGLARPVFTASTLSVQHSNKPILLVIDNGWASAPQWPQFISAASAIVTQSQQKDTPIHLLLTAPDVQNNPLKLKPLANTISPTLQLEDIHPQAWPVNRQAAAELIQKNQKKYQTVYYLSDGIKQHHQDIFYNSLKAVHNLYEIQPQQDPISASTLLLTKPTLTANGITQPITLLAKSFPQNLTLHAYTLKGELLTSAQKTIFANTTQTSIELTIPAEAQNKIDYLQINNSPSAGGTYLLDENSRKHVIGLWVTSNSANTPFVGSLYYLKKALAPLGEIKEGSLQQLLENPLSVLIIPDTLITDEKTIQTLETWVKNGGMLIRFSGPLLAGSTLNSQQSSARSTALVPIPLLQGARELGGAMTWEKPQHLSAFSNNSPFYGLSIPKDVTISKQLLIEPNTDTDHFVWAKLEDGTPLVTHRTIGKGQIILFHTNSTPDWSSLPLSELFVSMLEKLIHISFGVETPQGDSLLRPISLLNSFGALETPSPYAQTIQTNAINKTIIDPHHPPGLYGESDFHAALNLGDHIQSLKPSAPVGKTLTLSPKSTSSYALSSICILIGLLLILLDILLSMFLRGYLNKAVKTILPVLMLFCIGEAAYAQSKDQAISPPAALQTRLAYILTHDPSVDLASKQGLEGLSGFINERTTLKLAQPEGVDPAKDDLAFYPILYWPITPNIQPDAKRNSALNHYISHGGVILIDTQGHDSSATTEPIHPDLFSGEAPGAAEALKLATSELTIPTLSKLSDKDLLSRTFYILHDFPGRYDAMPIWISQNNPLINDGVSAVIVGENDWAHAWAVTSDGSFAYPIFPNTEKQRNLSYRFGMNLVMYALTGSYKADQVHVSALLRQLGASE
ncbi:DUF4159 domain-containing protein [Commensalibacter oyaizuii]|uniref:DUF4159 domain-containing protein n=1 Tax=Commensalibacter oyaizuii TaxID=3043873 RepID=A0ABT6Q0P8_9PROT|nr:DUF4159 domain-containing protein [Commensalibacter sp. TBRC 16381]MDI2090654.1 DUF4159 domain-containing protein [Commensalibacter sp. TBRC 16381]